MTLPSLRPLGFGEILDGAFTLYRRHFWLFAATSVLLTIAAGVGGSVLVVIWGIASSGLGGGGTLVTGLLVWVVGSAMMMVTWGALTWQAARSYTGQSVSLGEGASAGGRAAMTLVGAGFLATLAVIAGVVAVTLVLGAIARVVGALGITALSMGVGLVNAVLLLAAFCVLVALFFATLPSVVVEEKGPIESLARSFDLARGAMGRVTGLMLVTMLIIFLPLIAVVGVTGGFEVFADPLAAAAGAQVNPWNALVRAVLMWTVMLLAAPFMVSVIVLLYYDRRVRTEALDVQILADRLSLAGD